MPSPSFLAAFRAHLETRPNEPAIIWNSDVLTFRDLDSMAVAGAEQIASAGWGNASRVCLVAPKSPETIALLIAAWRAGHTILLPSAQLPATAQEDVAATGGASHIVRYDGATMDCAPVASAAITAPVGDALLMLTTSGSTGVPKVVPLPSRAVDAFRAWAVRRFEMTPGTPVLSYAPLNFDLSLLDVWAALAAGATSVLVDPQRATDPEWLTRTLAESMAKVVQSVPTTFRLLAEADGGAAVFPHVAHVLLTGEAAPASVLATLPRLFPKARFYNIYGCTETNDSTMHEATALDDHQAGQQPVGRPLPGVLTRVVGPDGTVVSGPGTGELWVHTPFQTTGYLDPSLNAGRFVADPSGTDKIFYRTGDLVRRTDDDVLWLVGRQDFVVKVQGVRTNLAEVEHVVQQHPDVVEAAVLALPDEAAGHLLYAVVRRHPGSALNSLVLRAQCMRQLPRTAIPSTITFVDKPLPRTSTGKADRHAIKATLMKGKKS